MWSCPRDRRGRGRGGARRAQRARTKVLRGVVASAEYDVEGANSRPSCGTVGKGRAHIDQRGERTRGQADRQGRAADVVAANMRKGWAGQVHGARRRAGQPAAPDARRPKYPLLLLRTVFRSAIVSPVRSGYPRTVASSPSSSEDEDEPSLERRRWEVGEDAESRQRRSRIEVLVILSSDSSVKSISDERRDHAGSRVARSSVFCLSRDF